MPGSTGAGLAEADRAVVGLSRQVRKAEEALKGYREAMVCHLGDFEGYADLRRALKDREADLSRQGAAQRKAAAAASLESLKVGDVIRVPSGRRSSIRRICPAETIVLICERSAAARVADRPSGPRSAGTR